MTRPQVPAGFTLLELLIAMAAVSVLLVGAAGLLCTASMAIRSARTGTSAALLAVQKLEQLEAGGVLVTAGEDYLALDGSPVNAAGAWFIRRWTTTPVSGSSINSWAAVEVFAPSGARIADVHAMVGTAGES